ncbi:pseudoazurin [Afifella sp. H1R]|uniref:pseudoazurin n=1 Tax=Afifella sp. H1R TaxID=2908841 RepID=UPI001F1B1715|nr:pseudoazurin [Afifella sp. H1R]MCF1503100.1 pseudoazurin [Afifella sp. H1R]
MKGFLVLALVLVSSFAHAETFEVKMLNRGEKGAMIYEPDFLRVAPGDTIRFLATTPGHNARTIAGLAPEGAEEIKTPLGETADVVAETPGIYGLKCSPHYAMGMVMMIAVGEEADPGELVLPDDLPRRARQRLEEIITENRK